MADKRSWKPPPQRFKLGDPDDEYKKCKEVEVFLRIFGQTHVDGIRFGVRREASLLDMRKRASVLLERKIDQPLFWDENGYQFMETTSPLSNYSNKCHLNVDLIFDDQETKKNVWRYSKYYLRSPQKD